eukprot:4455920-Pyramimonas_sp.AAC.1
MLTSTKSPRLRGRPPKAHPSHRDGVICSLACVLLPIRLLEAHPMSRPGAADAGAVAGVPLTSDPGAGLTAA